MSILKNAFVTYDENFIADDKADQYFKVLNELPGWKYNTVKGYPLNRETIVFADSEIKNDRKKIPAIWGDGIEIYDWPPELLEIKKTIEEKVKELTGKEWKYNIALGNRYTKAKDFISFHADNEEWGSTQSISSISLGVPRTFTYIGKNTKDDNKEKLSLVLKHGSLIFMGEGCQENYTHGMKKESLSKLANRDEKILLKYNKTRINVTFRVWNY
ncbi:MAG: alpha-ketoglutarate-dependent dioxygenase AlkB [Nitrososphaeraceae archaeon]|nr:alpha-ketoglutarate-dependent dioxygenase AlkB [Nitrososphaeraceae archaeon]